MDAPAPASFSEVNAPLEEVMTPRFAKNPKEISLTPRFAKNPKEISLITRVRRQGLALLLLSAVIVAGSVITIATLGIAGMPAAMAAAAFLIAMCILFVAGDMLYQSYQADTKKNLRYLTANGYG